MVSQLLNLGGRASPRAGLSVLEQLQRLACRLTPNGRCGFSCQDDNKSGISVRVEAPLKKNLLKALVALDAAVQSMPSASPKPDLLPLFARIDALAEQLPPDTEPALLHYLQKKSYGKARLFLQGRDAENQAGNCRHAK